MKFKENLKKYLPLLIFTLYLIIIHCNMLSSYGDDLWFAKYKGSLINIMSYRYMNWTSRFIFDTLLFIFNAYLPKLWIVIEILLCYLIYFSLNKIFNKENSPFIKYIIVLCFMMYPFLDMGSSGWITTTIVYIWPLAFGLFSFATMLNENLRNTKVLYILGVLSFFIAINQEQVCLLSIGFLIVFNIYNYLKKKKISKQMIIYMVLAVLMLINHLLCPGNAERTAVSIATSFPEFKNLSIIGKSGLALNNTLEMVFGQINYIFIFMMITILITLIKNKVSKKYIVLCCSIILLSLIIPFTQVFSMSKLYGGYLCPTGKNCDPVLPLIQYGSKKYILSIFVSLYTIMTTCILLYVTTIKTKDKYKIFLLPIMFIAAICSRFVVGFSPTLYISGYRTGIFMYFLFIGIIVSLLKNIKLKKEEQINLAILILSFIALYHFIDLSLNIKI